MDHCGKEKRKRHPRERANLLSLLTFSYTLSWFRKALKNDIEDKDLYEVLSRIESKKCGDFAEENWFLECKSKNPSIYHFIWKSFGWRVLGFGMIDLTWKVFNSVTEPLGISKLIYYFKPGQTDMTKDDAYCYAGLVMLLYIIRCVYIHNYIMWVQQLGIEIKTSFSSLLYRKALRLTPSAISDISLGNIVTLITKDVLSFQQSIWSINDAWTAALQSCVICYLLYAKIGVISLIGIGMILGTMPLQLILGKFVSKFRLSTGKRTDERLQVIQETLSTIRIIKMYTWEKFFTDRINSARLKEMKKMVTAYYIKITIILTGVLFSKMGFYCLVMAYSWMGYVTDTEVIFYIIPIFRDLKVSLGITIPTGLGKIAEMYSSLTRINVVLQAEELKHDVHNNGVTANPLINLEGCTVYIKDYEVLKNVSFEIKSGLTLVTGIVGSGKSALLKTILKYYPLTNGTLKVRGRISYASQDPWLFPSSIKQNIIFGEKLEEKRYREVVRVCALDYDFSLFDNGDQTILADRGLNMSKGQQARVNLARAVYKDSEIYLLDDCLTALDTQVRDYIFKECIKGFLKDKICILVTQATSQMQQADNVVIMEAGRFKSCGKPNGKVLQDMSNVACDDDLDREFIEKENVDESDENLNLVETEQVSRKKVYGEINKKGVVELGVYKKYFEFGGGFLYMFANLILFAIAQASDSVADQLLTKWVDQLNNLQLLQRNITIRQEDPLYNFTSFDLFQLEEAGIDEKFTINLFGFLRVASVLLDFLKTYALIEFCRRASTKIHKTMAHRIIYSFIEFFDSHFIGNVLNRFSQDVNNVDEMLPLSLNQGLVVTAQVTGVIALLAIVKAQFLLYSLGFFIFLFFVRRLYLPTGRSLKRLEAATRSPMIGHLNASLEGLTTIRAYNAENILIEEFDRHQDLYSSAHYSSLCSASAFGFMMDFMCSIFIMSIVARFLIVDGDTSAGDVGLALTQVFTLAGLVQLGVRQWAELESLMTSAERLFEYTDIKLESNSGTTESNWPTQGTVAFKNVSLTYSTGDKVLKDLCFEVEPRQKIGIVGRTGAGKSSIISLLFRLYDYEGDIIIDGVNTKVLTLEYLRKHLAIIPQDPVLFSGTIRSNLDPFNEFSDEDLWHVLERVKLKDLVNSLRTQVRNSGSNFSSGQKQLLCMARAILRKTNILVLDEATANMDHETDILLHKSIEMNFKNCTIFIIAHRLHSILECNKVLVLDRGEIREFDDPMSLLENVNGMFYQMVKQAGFLNYLS